MLIKHMRLIKDMKVETNQTRKYALGTGVYDVYKGKNPDGTSRFDSIFINLIANGEKEVSFLESFGNKGAILKFAGDITPGKPYQNKNGEWVSTINLTIKTVEFSEVRGAAKEKVTTPTPTPAAINNEIEDIFANFDTSNFDTSNFGIV